MAESSLEERDKSRAVRPMFSSIAGRYDLLNHILSANLDRRWRRLCALAVLIVAEAADRSV